MQTSLPLVLELHHPAMRPRHWKQLMKVRHAAFLRCPSKLCHQYLFCASTVPL